MAEEFFHTYIIGGARDSARLFIENFLVEQKINIKNNPDCVISEFTSFSVDHSRELKEWQSFVPVGKKKVYIVYTDFITNQAENALLKTFEEPIPNTHIIFAIPKPETLLPTLLSRARVVYLENEEDELFEKEVSKFLKMKIGERLAIVVKLAEKSDEEDASAEKRKKAILFVENLEKSFSEDVQKNKDKLETIMKLKKYLYMSGSSVRSILETISFLV